MIHIIDDCLLINNIEVRYSIVQYFSVVLKESCWGVDFYYKNNKNLLDIEFQPDYNPRNVCSYLSLLKNNRPINIYKTDNMINLFDAVFIIDNLILL